MPSEDEAKPTIPSTPTKKKSSSKEPITPNKSPRKKLAADDLQSMKREAINAVFDFAVKGDTLALIAERFSPAITPQVFNMNTDHHRISSERS